MDSVVVFVFGLMIIAFVIWISIILPYQMAKRRGRSAALWVLISIIISPLVSIIVLKVIGDAEDKTDLTDTFA